MSDLSSQNQNPEEPSANELLDEFSLKDVLEAPTEEEDISGIPIEEFLEPIAVESETTELE